MLDIKFIRENPAKVVEGALKKGVTVDIEQLIQLDEERRRRIKARDEARQAHHGISKNITALSGDEKQRAIVESRKMKNTIDELEKEVSRVEEKFSAFLRRIPNLPFDDVPVGPDSSANVVLREVGKKREFDFRPRDYMDIAESLNLIDTKRAAKVSGSRFGYLKREAALLEFALVHYVFDFVSDERNIARLIAEGKLPLSAWPFIPVVPPVLIKEEMMRGMGYIDTEKDLKERYFLDEDKMFLVGTSEQSIGPLHADEILDEAKLPRRYVAFSTCFRREAGSYGKDTHGILRVHQFDKVEMFTFSTPETSKDEHRLMLGIEERLMQGLGIPYRVVQLCAGDLSQPAAATFDIEAWLPGQNDGKGEYRETHSSSNTTDFQARRLNIKVRRASGKTEFLHTLNGTAFAIGRMLIAIIENYQNADGSVTIPDALRPYMGGIAMIRREFQV